MRATEGCTTEADAYGSAMRANGITMHASIFFRFSVALGFRGASRASVAPWASVGTSPSVAERKPFRMGSI